MKNEVKRLGIFFIRDNEGEIEKYIIYLLNSLKNILDDLHILCNREIYDKHIQKLEAFSEKISITSSLYSLNSWSEELKNLYKEDNFVNKYEELVLLDNSFFGPFVEWQEVFEEMALKNVDFWGITKSPSQIKSSDVYDFKIDNVEEYIENYFVVFNNKVLRSELFQHYWINMPQIKNEDELERYQEKLTLQLKKKFKYDTYVNIDLLSGLPENNIKLSRYMPDYLLINQKMPILLREVFEVNYDKYLDVCGGECIAKALEFIKEKYEYDVDMIWENIIRCRNLYDIKQSLHLNYILDTNSYMYGTDIKGKTAIIIHLYYTDLLMEVYDYIKNLPTWVDLYITTGKDENIEIIKKNYTDVRCNKMEVRKVDNRGRDLGALIVGCNDLIDKYDYICFTHDKKTSGNTGPITVGKSFMHLVMDNVIYNERYITNVVKTLETNPRLGIVAPPAPIHGIYFMSIGREWTICFEQTINIAKKLGIKAKIEENKMPFILGSSFWFKSDALKDIFKYGFVKEDFPKEPMGSDGTFSHGMERIFPYVAQSNGYYAAWAMTNYYAGLDMGNKTHVLSEIVSSIQNVNSPYIESKYQRFLEKISSKDQVIDTTVYYRMPGERFRQENSFSKLVRVTEDGDFTIIFDVEFENSICELRIDPTSETDVLIHIDDYSVDSITMEQMLPVHGIEVFSGYYWFPKGDVAFSVKMNLNGKCRIFLKGNIQRADKIFIDELRDRYKIVNHAVIFDFGDGYTEYNAYRKLSVYNEQDNTFNLEYKFDDVRDVKSIRFDPSDEKNIIWKMKHFAINGDKYEKFSTNGQDIGDGKILFINEQSAYFVNKPIDFINSISIQGDLTFVRQSLLAINKNVVQMGIYFKYDNDYSENHVIRKLVYLNNKGHFNIKWSFDKIENVKGIRFDPLEGRRCKCKINTFCINEVGFKVKESNGRSLISGSTIFDTDDPNFFLNMNFKEIYCIEISGNILIYPEEC